MGEIIDFQKAVAQEVQAIATAPTLQERRLEAIKKLPRFRGEVPSKNVIRGLPGVSAGEIFWVTGDNKAYLVAEKDGKRMTIKALDETATISTGVTIYEMNKTIVSKEPLFDWENLKDLTELSERVKNWFNDNEIKDQYFLLYGRDMHYLSLINFESGVMNDDGLAILNDALFNAGQLISMDFNTSDDEQSIEIWVRTKDSPAELLYLFPYDKGVITI